MSTPAAYVAIPLRPAEQPFCASAQFSWVDALDLRAEGLFDNLFHLIISRLPWKCWGRRFLLGSVVGNVGIGRGVYLLFNA